jgi:SAM-dependent methyltransferase
MSLITPVKRIVLQKLTQRQLQMEHRRKVAQVERLLGRHSDAKNLQDLFFDVDDELWFWILTDGPASVPALKSLLPAMPADDIQRKFTGSVGFGEAPKVYKVFKNIARVYGKEPADLGKVLDFGCGWGRYLRLFLKDVPPENLFGLDVDPEIIAVCRQSRIPADLHVGTPFPPTRFADNTFDVVYAYSVFSHLSEKAHLAWLEEFKRILRPGGILMATTWGKDFIRYIDGLRRIKDPKDVPAYLNHIKDKPAEWQEYVSSFGDIDQTLAAYDGGAFCFSGNGYEKKEGAALDNTFYGEACIPRQYALKQWSRYFKDVDFIHAYVHNATPQHIIVAQK